MEPRVVELQFAIFVVDTDPTRGGYSRIASSLKGSCNFLNNTLETVLPTNDAPPDIPRLILDARDSSFQFTVTSQKLLFAFRNIGNNNFQEIITGFRDNVDDITAYVYNNSWFVNRVGIIVQAERDMNNNENAPSFLRRRYVDRRNTLIVNNPHELGINYVNRLSLLNLAADDTNLLIMLSQKGSGNSRQSGVLFGTFDINTKPEYLLDGTQFSRDQVSNFTDSAIRALEPLPAQYMGG